MFRPLDWTKLPRAVADRIEKEAEENDEIYRARRKFPVTLGTIHYGHREFLNWMFRQFPKPANQCSVLDVGIGEGHSSIMLAKLGASVTSIDVSAAALERAAEFAEQNSVRIDFRQMAGEWLDFPDASFDVVLCSSAFHHMDIPRAASEFARVLRPGGRAIMNEPLASNPPAWVYRRLVTWRTGTSEETPLHLRDIELLKPHFSAVSWRGMYMTSILLFGVDRIWDNRNAFVHGLTERMFPMFLAVDEAITRYPTFGRFAWRICLVAEK